MAWEYTIESLQTIALLFEESLKQALLQRIYPYGNPEVRGQGDKYATGNLYNSIKTSVEIDPNGVPVILVEYLDYYTWVNKGRDMGVKRVPTNALIDWIKVRGIRSSDEMARKSLAYAINNSRKKKNKKPIPIMVLQRWIEEKGIQISEEQRTLSLAFAIQQNIFKYGIRRTRIWDVGLDNITETVDNPGPELSREFESLYEAMSEDINVLLDNILRKQIPTSQ